MTAGNKSSQQIKSTHRWGSPGYTGLQILPYNHSAIKEIYQTCKNVYIVPHSIEYTCTVDSLLPSFPLTSTKAN